MTTKSLFRKIISLCIAATLLIGSGCTAHSPKAGEIHVAALKGPTAIGMVKLLSDSDAGKTSDKYTYQFCGTAAEISSGIAKGDIDIAAVPANLASILYQVTEGGIQIAAINTLGVLYIGAFGEEADTISSIADLAGKTIYTTGQGTTPEYTLRYILSGNGIDPDRDINIIYCSEASETVAQASLLSSGIVMLPQPYMTVARGKLDNLKIVADVAAEWEKLDDTSTVVTGVLIVRTEFVKKYPKQFEDFMKSYEASCLYANTNVEETAALVEEFDIFKAAIAKAAIPQCNITFLTGDTMKNKLCGYLKVLYEANPTSVGGKLPEDAAFYHHES